MVIHVNVNVYIYWKYSQYSDDLTSDSVSKRKMLKLDKLQYFQTKRKLFWQAQVMKCRNKKKPKYQRYCDLLLPDRVVWKSKTIQNDGTKTIAYQVLHDNIPLFSRVYNYYLFSRTSISTCITVPTTHSTRQYTASTSLADTAGVF